jgi:hypothetical protein
MARRRPLPSFVKALSPFAVTPTKHQPEQRSPPIRPEGSNVFVPAVNSHNFSTNGSIPTSSGLVITGIGHTWLSGWLRGNFSSYPQFDRLFHRYNHPLENVCRSVAKVLR